MMITWSPVSTWGAKIGFCLPRRMRATWAASRPRTWPSASTTYQSRVRSRARGENVRLAGEGMRATPLRFGSVAPGMSSLPQRRVNRLSRLAVTRSFGQLSGRGEEPPGGGGGDNGRPGGGGAGRVGGGGVTPEGGGGGAARRAERARHGGRDGGLRAAQAGQVAGEA